MYCLAASAASSQYFRNHVLPCLVTLVFENAVSVMNYNHIIIDYGNIVAVVRKEGSIVERGCLFTLYI
jgi:hypothetical protein